MSKHRTPSRKSIRAWRRFLAEAKAGRIRIKRKATRDERS